jgi:hypothetical protein
VNKPIVKYKSGVINYLNDLTKILFEKEYFGFEENALEYIANLKNFVTDYISILPKHEAPAYFSKYEKNMQYVFYPINNRTTWYFFFLQEAEVYVVCYITNNHFEGQYIR